MKPDVVHFIAKFLECQQLKAGHHYSVGVLQPHDVSMTKWEVIYMDFVVGLPLTTLRHTTLIFIVDKLIKSAHFIPVKDTMSLMWHMFL